MAFVQFASAMRSGLRLQDLFTAMEGGALVYGDEGESQSARFEILVDGEAVEAFYAGPIISETEGAVSYLRFGSENQPWLTYGSRLGPTLFQYSDLAGFQAQGGLTAAYIMAGNDSLIGSSKGDYIEGYAGDDTLDGGAGADTFDGGSGNDTYILDNREDRVFEAVGGGYDVAWTYVSYALAADAEVEELRAAQGAFSVALTGSAFSNVIVGTAGDDTLDGGGGVDTLIGGAGSDVYIVDNSFDLIWDDGYNDKDTVLTGVSYALSANIEVLKAMAGTAFLQLEGNALANEIVGNIGANRIYGFDGNDSLYGDGGRDSIYGGSGRDSIYGGIGNDHLDGGSGDDRLYGDVGSDRLYGGSGNDRLYGGTGANRLYGGSGRDTLYGGVHADRLYGDTGNDKLYGDGGNDILRGGLGRDTLSGGFGRDIFVFDTKPNKSKNLDRITDFNVKDDRIWLDNKYFKKLGSGSSSHPKKLHAEYFTIGSRAEDENDYLIYNKNSGYLYYDKDGSGAAKAVAIAILKKGLALKYNDFYVV